jgi:hypothetical protein
VDGEPVTYAIVNTEDVGYPSFGWKVEAESHTMLVNMAHVGPTLVQTGDAAASSVPTPTYRGDLLEKQVDEYVAAAQ